MSQSAEMVVEAVEEKSVRGKETIENGSVRLLEGHSGEGAPEQCPTWTREGVCEPPPRGKSVRGESEGRE